MHQLSVQIEEVMAVATSKPANKGVQIGGFNIWWDGDDQIQMQLNEHDSDLPKGALWVTFSGNPDSANYHPQNFNQCVAALRAHDKPAPGPVAESPRDLEARGFMRSP
jgi:hypothetical protein